MQDRLEKEKAFHNDAFSRGIRRSLDAYYSIFITIRKDFRDMINGFVRGKRILECGCGVNSYAYELAAVVDQIHGIDISDEAVRQSREQAERGGLKNCRFDIMNAESLDFPDATFHFVFGVGIIHHLDLAVFYKEAARVLRTDGRMLFMEPLGYNPFINLYRKLTPRLRTPDEHPLLKKDLDLIHEYFGEVHVRYYHFFTLLTVPLRNTPLFKPVLRVFEAIDRFCFRFLPGFKYLAWYTIIEAGEPKKEC